MSKKILVATDKPFAAAAITKMKEAVATHPGYELELLEGYEGQQPFIDAAKTADAIIIRSDKATKEVLETSTAKVIVRAGAGFDNIDLAAAKDLGIVAMNTPGQNSNAVAELVLGMMVFMARGKFTGKPGVELKVKKIGIHAYGNVGKNVARVAKGFGMEVLAFDPFVAKEVIEADGVTVCDSIEELYSTCDYVSLHIPANKHTIDSINFDLLSKMPEGGTLVNTARKEVIDEADMVKLMEARADFSYISDIAPDNKATLEEKFADRCLFTPKKMGAQTAEANINAGVAAIEQIVAFIENGDTTYQVNK